MLDEQKDDPACAIALAALAMCTTAFAHEAFGHGGACLLLGGRIALLNNAFFHCSIHAPLIDIAGPAGNLFVGLAAWALQARVPRERPALRFYFLCVMAFSLFWEAGYVVFAMVRNTGDTVFAWNGFVGPTNAIVRGAGIALGAAAYFVVSRMLGERASAFAPASRSARLLRTAWFTGVAVQLLAASLFAPDRLGAMHDAGLSAVASFPLLFVSPRTVPASQTTPPVARDTRILALGAIVFAAFALTMGRGVG